MKIKKIIVKPCLIGLVHLSPKPSIHHKSDCSLSLFVFSILQSFFNKKPTKERLWSIFVTWVMWNQKMLYSKRYLFKKKLFEGVQKKCGSENFEKLSEKHQWWIPFLIKSVVLPINVLSKCTSREKISKKFSEHSFHFSE